MKKLVLLACVFVLLIATAGAASAHNPEPGQFTITGYTTDYGFQTGPNGRTWFHLTAEGTAEGYFNGPFTFEEWGVVDLDLTKVPPTGSGKGTNTGVVTITTADGQERVRFAGVTDSINVSGKFTVAQEDGSRGFAGLQGYGSYRGNAGFAFTVTFTGKFEH
jgi:hypothetical protein